MKKTPIIPLLGLFVPVVLMAPAAFADVAADLKQAEGLYQACQYTQAEQAYLTVVREADPNKPADAEAAFNARKGLASVYIATDRLPQARDAVQQLLSRYAQYESLPHAIHEIAEGAKPLLKLPQVRQLYQDMVTAQPGDAQAIWLKMGIAVASAYLAEDQAVDATLQNIISQHGTDGRAAEVLNHIAWAYRKLQRYNAALTIYQYVVNNWPDRDRVVFAQHGIVICHLGLGNPQAADAALEVMLQKFGKDENTPKLLAWAIYGYLQAGEIEGAYNIFDVVLQTYPEAPETIDALLTLATAAIQDEDRARIEPIVQTLLTRFAATEVKAAALHTVANMLAWKCVDYVNHPLEEQNLAGICNRCLLAIANYSVATWPKSDWAMWAQRDMATVAIQRGDGPNAEAAIGCLAADYADRKDAPAALDFLADCYLDAKKHENAGVIYQRLAEKYPNHDLMPLVKIGLGQVQVCRGDDQAAEAIYQEVLTNYADWPDLSEGVNLMAEGYWKQAQRDRVAYKTEVAADHNTKALVKWHLIIDGLPASRGQIARAHFFIGECYRYLKDDEQAIEHYQEVVKSCPTYEYAWLSLIRASNILKSRMRAGLISEDEARPRIRTCMEQIRQNYPNCPMASSARRWLDTNGNEISGGQGK